MNWVIALSHMVGCEDVGHTSKLVEQTILKSEEGCWSHNRGLWEYATNYLLTSALFDQCQYFRVDHFESFLPSCGRTRTEIWDPHCMKRYE